MTTFGRKPVGNDAGWGTILPNQARATIVGTIPSQSWLIEFGGRVGKGTATNVSGQFAAYAYSSNTVTNLLVASNTFTLNVLMADQASGGDFIATPAGPYQLNSGQPVALAFRSPGNAVFGQTNSAYTMHERNGLGSFPNPFSASSTFAAGVMSLWIEYQTNRSPSVPSSVAINGLGLSSSDIVIADTTPTFAGVFRDLDEELWVGGRKVWSVGQADKISNYHVQIARRSDGVVVHDTGWVAANSTDQAQRRFEYTTPALTPGSYWVRTRVADLFGASSGWSEHPFTIASATVSLNGSPTGKQTTQTPTSFAWTFNNTGPDATTHKQIRLLKNGVAVKTSGEIAATVAANATSSFSWAETTFAALEWGGSYSYQVRAKYLGIWTDWSPQRSFTTNAYPSKPTELSPNGTAFGSFPTLSAVVVDPDDNSSTLSTHEWEITRPNSTVTVISAGTYVNGNRWQKALTSTQVTTQGAYSWRFRARDAAGLWSPWSDYATFQYGSYPTVALAVPVLTSSSPILDWATSGTNTPTPTQQTAYTAYVFNSLGTQIWTSGRVLSQATQVQLPAALLRNGQSYSARVDVENNVTLVGSSNTVNWTVALTPPASLTGVSAIPFLLPGDYEGKPSGIIVSWDPSAVASNIFDRYEITRTVNGVERLIAHIHSQSETQYVDPVPPFGLDVPYRVRQVTLQGLDELPSAYVMASAQVNPGMLTITDVFEGVTSHIAIPLVSKLDEEIVTDEAIMQTWETKPTALVGTLEAASLSISARIRDYPGQRLSPLAQKEMLRRLFKKRVGTNGRKYPRTTCIRDHTGLRAFGRSSGLRMGAGQLMGHADVDFRFIETSFIEGEEVDAS